MEKHPVEVLRAILDEEFSEDLPERVHPVRLWCADPQFFPGATGLLSNGSWADVVPGSYGVIDHLPSAHRGGVMVLGNYQATLASYGRILDGSIGGFPTTWRVLRQLLAPVLPTEVFLTNAFVGLPDLAKDTAPFPTTPSFTSRCQRLLTKEIKLFRPRAIVCLGVPAATMLASITPALASWRKWPGYTTLHGREQASVPGCDVGAAEFVAVAVRHPSAVVSTKDRQSDAELLRSAVL